jgi:hypothetical protein
MFLTLSIRFSILRIHFRVNGFSRYVEMRCVINGFAVFKNDSLRRFVPDAGFTGYGVGNVACRLHNNKIDVAVYARNFFVNARTDWASRAVFEQQNGFFVRLRRIILRVVRSNPI